MDRRQLKAGHTQLSSSSSFLSPSSMSPLSLWSWTLRDGRYSVAVFQRDSSLALLLGFSLCSPGLCLLHGSRQLSLLATLSSQVLPYRDDMCLPGLPSCLFSPQHPVFHHVLGWIFFFKVDCLEIFGHIVFNSELKQILQLPTLNIASL